MSLASLVPLTTGPPTQTGSPTASVDSLTLPPRSLTTVLPTRSQVEVMPSAAFTTMELPLFTDSITPRW